MVWDNCFFERINKSVAGKQYIVFVTLILFKSWPGRQCNNFLLGIFV
jgi:hypothetical protein